MPTPLRTVNVTLLAAALVLLAGTITISSCAACRRSPTLRTIERIREPRPQLRERLTPPRSVRSILEDEPVVADTPTERYSWQIGGCNASAVILSDGTVRTLTARHCPTVCRQRLGADACLIDARPPAEVTPLPIGRAENGPATVHTHRGTFDVQLQHLGHIGYIATPGWTPRRGDSGSPVVQDGKIVAVLKGYEIPTGTGLMSLIDESGTPAVPRLLCPPGGCDPPPPRRWYRRA